MSKFRQAVERALAKYYVPYNTTFGVPPDPDWERLYNFYEARYLNPDSPERDNEVKVIGYYKLKIASCGCGAILQFGHGEIKYNSAGVGVVKCPSCGAYPVVSDKNALGAETLR